MRPKANFRDVSRLASVSEATVSRVANGTGRVDPKIAERVRQTAASLGVELDRRSRARTIAFVLSNRDLAHPVHSRVLQGAESYCLSRGWEPVIIPVGQGVFSPAHGIRLPQLLEARSLVRGAVLVGATSAELMSALTTQDVPFAVLGNNVVGEWQPHACDTVFFDGVQGASEMTEFLIELGHVNIWYVADCALPWFAQSAEGYRRSMEGAGLIPHVAELRTT